MPSVLRRSGPDIESENGTVRTPRAAIHLCVGCGFEGASFGDVIDGKNEYFCGWDGQPVCKGKGTK